MNLRTEMTFLACALSVIAIAVVGAVLCCPDVATACCPGAVHSPVHAWPPSLRAAIAIAPPQLLFVPEPAFSQMNVSVAAVLTANGCEPPPLRI